MLLLNPSRFPAGGSFSPASGLYVCCVDDADIYVSTNLTSWTAVTMPGANWWPGGLTKLGGNYVAPSSGGADPERAATSTDGLTWTGRTTPAQTDDYGWYYAAHNGSRIVVVGNDEAASPHQSSMYSDNNGVTWTMGSLTGKNYDFVTWVSSLGLFIALDPAAVSNNIATSSNGSTWTSRTTPASLTCRQLAWGSSKLRSVGNNTSGSGTTEVLKSTNGTTYTSASAGVSLTYMDWVSTIWTGSKFVAMGWESGADLSYTIESSDGDTWTENAGTLPGKCYLIHDGNQYLAVGIDGADNKVYWSSDLSSWADVATISAPLSGPTGFQFIPT